MFTKLSIIIPAYNEEKYIENTLRSVLNFNYKDTKKEVIIIESSSTDNTKNIIEKYRKYKEIKIIYQESPKGKGNAVREGFKHITGDVILIQDADNEYKIEDYPKLLDPIFFDKAVFVLGERAGQSSKLRKFKDEPFKEILLNFGHRFFTYLINICCNSKLDDPFTMFKVFKKDLILDQSFYSNKFDFDHELIIKLLRKANPVIVKVNYSSRQFSDGKKIKILIDPITWLKAIFKYGILKL